VLSALSETDPLLACLSRENTTKRPILPRDESEHGSELRVMLAMHAAFCVRMVWAFWGTQ